MKVNQIHIEKSNLENINLDEVINTDAQIGLIFGGQKTISESHILEKLSESKTPWVGCTTAGEITEDGVYDESIILSSLKFEGENSRVFLASEVINDGDDGRTAGKKMAAQLPKDGLKFVFVISPGLNVNGSAVIKGINEEIGEETPISGGLAGDGGEFVKTHTIIKGEMADNLIIGIGFYGDSFAASQGCWGGWTPFGVHRVVTKAKENILYTLNDEPALEVYKKYLGDDASGLPESGLHFPFAVVNDEGEETGIIRTILGINEDEGSLILAGDIEEGSTLRLMHANNQELVLGARKAAEMVGHSSLGNNGSLAILVSCVGRKLVLGGNTDDEIESVTETFGPSCNITGFYSYGELGPVNKGETSRLHNQTMTICYLTES